MSYEKFQQGAALNAEFEVIPTKLKLLSEGVVLDDNGYIKCDGKTYMPNMVKLAELPKKIQPLFLEKDKFGLTKGGGDIENSGDKPSALVIDSNLSGVSQILLEQLQSITNPKPAANGEKHDMSNEIKKANAVCNIADKIISIVDLSLKVEILNEKKRRKRMYE